MDTADIIILVVLLVYTIIGAVRGLVATLVDFAISLVAWVGSAVVASALAPDVPWLLTFLVCFVVVQIAGFLIQKALDLATKIPFISGINRLLGGLLGFLRASVLLTVFCSILVGLHLIPADVVREGGLLALFSSLAGA